MRKLFDGAFEGVCLLDMRRYMLYANNSFCQMLGGSSSSMEGCPLAEWLDPAAVSLIQEHFNRVPENGDRVSFSCELKTLERGFLPLNISAQVLSGKSGNAVALLVYFQERVFAEPQTAIRERVVQEERLWEVEQRYRAIVEAQTEFIERFNPDFVISYVNEAYCQYFGETAEELVGHTFCHHMLADDLAAIKAEIVRLRPEHPTETAEEMSQFKNGERRWIQWIDTGIFDEGGNLVEIQAVGRDVTDKKHMEQELRRQRDLAERYLDVAGVMVVAFDPEGRIAMINGEGCRLLGAPREELLGLGWCDNFVPPSCREKVRRLFNRVHIGDLDPCDVYENLLLDCRGKERYFQWRNMALFDEEGVFQGLLSSGMDVTERERNRQSLLKSKAELQNSLAQLEETWENTVEVLSQATEFRDPYTAGHQRKVAALAVVLARELGFSHERVQVVRMAALIHDIGKQGIPAEILSKPGRLREVEFNLIRLHPESAAEIIEKAGFPWDLAEIVRQHHERMDGSGYPRGLRGDDIVMEARILAVADVVEAISSHRPYRPALGLDVALNEIRDNSGVLYDPDVVRACLDVFLAGAGSLPAWGDLS